MAVQKKHPNRKNKTSKDFLLGQFHKCNLRSAFPTGQALVNDIHTIQPSVNGINEVGVYLKKEAEPPFAIYIQKLLDELNSQWENVCKQVRESPHGVSSCLQDVRFSLVGFHRAVFEPCNKTAQ